jgi:hypothetical protein
MEYIKLDENRYKLTTNVNTNIYIDLDKVEQEIIDIDRELNEIPRMKTKPDQETLDHWNATVDEDRIEMLESNKKDSEDFIKKLRAIK